MRDQQELTAQLSAKLNAARAGAIVSDPAIAAPPPIGAGAGQTDLAQKVAQLEANMGSSQRNLEERLKTFGPFVFSGDFRLRAEPTFGGPVDRSQDRFRERIRLRFNVEGKLNDQLKGGFSLASGDLNNPISTNQTLNQYDTRKPIAIDRAYATYTPSWFKPLTLTGGKFAYPWFNTELVWDKDLNPEGAGETLAFNVKTPLFKKFSVVGFQLPFAENKRTATNDKSLYNTMVYGEQLQTFWQLGDRVKLSAYASFYDWKFADSIALSLLTANSASPDDALLALNNNGQQNSIATVTVTNPTSGAKTITSAQFASKFGILDSLAQLDIATPSERWPLTFIGDFARKYARLREREEYSGGGGLLGAVRSARSPRLLAGNQYWTYPKEGRLAVQLYAHHDPARSGDRCVQLQRNFSGQQRRNSPSRNPISAFRQCDAATEWTVRPATGNRWEPSARAASVGAVAIRRDVQILGGKREIRPIEKKKGEGGLRFPRGVPADCRFRNPCPTEAGRHPRGIFPEYYARPGIGGTRGRPV